MIKTFWHELKSMKTFVMLNTVPLKKKKMALLRLITLQNLLILGELKKIPDIFQFA